MEATPENAFLRELSEFQAPIARAGMWNSLAQVLVKIASPGVPDFYQGNEIWALDLVDPDNRRAVNYEVRRQMLTSLRTQAARNRVELVSRLRENFCDGAIKMFITSEALRFRRDHAELFSQGTYAGLAAEGSRARHVVGFARATDREIALALTGRFFLRLSNSHGKPIGEVWGDTAVALPKNAGQQSFQNIFTGQTIVPRERDGRMVLPLNEAFCECPVALLYAESHD
ncbi:MAG: hypothetical protein ABSH31_13995 [Bryobacteraceae bacterium]